MGAFELQEIFPYCLSLCEWDVITIEPGVYIPKEKIGVRIEDDYWIIKGGNLCLSENLPREADDIEQFMQVTLEEPDEDYSEGLNGQNVM